MTAPDRAPRVSDERLKVLFENVCMSIGAMGQPANEAEDLANDLYLARVEMRAMQADLCDARARLAAWEPVVRAAIAWDGHYHSYTAGVCQNCPSNALGGALDALPRTFSNGRSLAALIAQREAAARAENREACAKVAETYRIRSEAEDSVAVESGYMQDGIAAAIRAIGV